MLRLPIPKVWTIFFADRHFAPLGLRRGARSRSINMPPRWGCSFEHPGLFFYGLYLCEKRTEKSEGL